MHSAPFREEVPCQGVVWLVVLFAARTNFAVARPQSYRMRMYGCSRPFEGYLIGLLETQYLAGLFLRQTPGEKVQLR